MTGRAEEGQRLFDRLLKLRNDVGLLSEEYDVDANRLVGNLPQAFSHVAPGELGVQSGAGGQARQPACG